jgi:hypothetical protein
MACGGVDKNFGVEIVNLCKIRSMLFIVDTQQLIAQLEVFLGLL